jgi:hypothetical protein
MRGLPRKRQQPASHSQATHPRGVRPRPTPPHPPPSATPPHPRAAAALVERVDQALAVRRHRRAVDPQHLALGGAARARQGPAELALGVRGGEHAGGKRKRWGACPGVGGRLLATVASWGPTRPRGLTPETSKDRPRTVSISCSRLSTSSRSLNTTSRSPPSTHARAASSRRKATLGSVRHPSAPPPDCASPDCPPPGCAASHSRARARRCSSSGSAIGARSLAPFFFLPAAPAPLAMRGAAGDAPRPGEGAGAEPARAGAVVTSSSTSAPGRGEVAVAAKPAASGQSWLPAVSPHRNRTGAQAQSNAPLPPSHPPPAAPSVSSSAAPPPSAAAASARSSQRI